MPERAIGGSEGGPFLMAAGGTFQGRQFVLNEMLVGTWGARADRDGIEGISNPAANISNQPIEMIEAEMPVEVVRYGFVPDSGGPGRNRGGMAFIREFRFHQETSFNLRGDRRDHPPYGIEGGGTGAPSAHILVSSTAPNACCRRCRCGFHRKGRGRIPSRWRGGGGYGAPFERDPARVLADVVEEKVTVGGAARDYGVVIDPTTFTINEAATRALRSGAIKKAAE